MRTPAQPELDGVHALTRALMSVAVHDLPLPAILALADGTVLEVNDLARALDPTFVDPGRVLDAVPEGWNAEPLDATGSIGLVVQRPSLELGAAFDPGDPAHAEVEDVRDQLLRQFFTAPGVVFAVFDIDGGLIESNAEWDRLLGFDRERDDVDVWSLVVDEGQATVDVVRASLESSTSSTPELRMRTAGGGTCDISWSLSLDPHNRIVFGVGRDVTAQRRLTEELEQMAFYDGLTGLANRAFLLRRLEFQLAEGYRPALLFCDLDRFKVVNDSLGHAAGDQLLRLLGDRLSRLTRSGRDVVARLGGDEFVILLGSVTERQAALEAERILEAVHQPFELDGRTVRIGMSIGVAIARSTSASPERLLGEADTAAYFVKDQRRGSFAIHDDELQATLDRRFAIEAGLLAALDDDGFEIAYQPVVSLRSKTIIGVEALVRWRDAGGVLHYPAEFIEVAEESGLISDIGDLVLRRAVSTVADLNRQGADISVSVNATAAQISSPSFVLTVDRALRSSGLDPRHLVLELTESAIVSNLESTVPVLELLRSAGVRIAIDDFGTGYSSLSYLQQLPIDIVKIDRSFVSRLGEDPVAVSVVAAVVTLCDALQLDVVVEGIEEADQASVVADLGCDAVQGFFFHRPMPLVDLEQRLATVLRPS